MNLKESIIRILREETDKNLIFLRRRIYSPEMFEELHLSIYTIEMFLKPCKYKTIDGYFNDFIEMSVSNFVGNIEEFDNLSDKDLLPINKFVEKFIIEKFGNSIKNVYHINCGD